MSRVMEFKIVINKSSYMRFKQLPAFEIHHAADAEFKITFYFARKSHGSRSAEHNVLRERWEKMKQIIKQT